MVTKADDTQADDTQARNALQPNEAKEIRRQAESDLFRVLPGKMAVRMSADYISGWMERAVYEEAHRRRLGLGRGPLVVTRQAIKAAIQAANAVWRGKLQASRPTRMEAAVIAALQELGAKAVFDGE